MQPATSPSHSNSHLSRRATFRTAAAVVAILALSACVKSGNSSNNDGQQAGDAGDMGTGDTNTPSDIISPPDTGCPSTTGSTITGTVRLTNLHNALISGPSVIPNHKVPCGREVADPSKETCGQAPIYVWLCTTPGCTAAGDPLRTHVNPEGVMQLTQTSFETEPFEFCGVDDGTYYLVPVIDHDRNAKITNYDWTMGIRDLDDPDTEWPARVHGYEVTVAGADVALGTSLAPTSADASPVIVNYFYYRHPTPAWQSEDAWLYVAATVNPDVALHTVGMRAIDLTNHQERDHISASPETDAMSLGYGGSRYEGDLRKLTVDNDVVYFATDTNGVILTVRLGADGTAVQGNTIDLTKGATAISASDSINAAAVVEVGAKKFLFITNAAVRGAPLPHNPINPVIVVDISGLGSADVTEGTIYNMANMVELDKVRLDDAVAFNGVVYTAETGFNSKARANDGLNRLWAWKLDATGAVTSHTIYEGAAYNAEGDVPECSSRPAYRTAALWVGAYQGATHAFLGNLRTISMWKFAGDDPAAGVRVQGGSGFDTFDMRLDDYAVGYSLMVPSPDASKLFVFGDCKSHYTSVRYDDWAGGAGAREQSRRRIAVLDLATADTDGLPTFHRGYDDTTTGPDIIRLDSGANETLSETSVLGLGFDCRAAMWNLYDIFGYTNLAGNGFGADCVSRRVEDAVATEHHLYIVGSGDPSYEGNGLGVSSEVLILDLASGRAVMNPEWQWFYEGSVNKTRYGYYGVTLGERKDRELARGLFVVPK